MNECMKETRFKRVKNSLNDFFFAPKANCLGCMSALGCDKDFLCAKCYASLSPLYLTYSGITHICNLCGSEIKNKACKCGGKRKNAYTVYSAYRFEQPVSTIVKAFKYRSSTYLSVWIAEQMILALKGGCDFDIITFVPMHFLRKVSRGYNQSEILAKHISIRLNIPLKGTLKRSRYTRKQASLRASLRKKNLINAFKIVNKDIKGKHVLLIDDVRTTGSTIIECARVLRENGAGKVSALTLACGK